ncbi:hypothetical protein RGQ29_026010 [Quercus rubra]|uniref:Thaumatin-like protein n=1 Tax=Quercus rubra TaxID=3512 RepID=A0AAN7IRB9_QUERU|nr:hypothetical protein RGQ29_026010 [Quercus rubra]
MMKTLALYGLILTFFFLSGAHSAKITFTNNCPRTIWPGTLALDQKPQLSKTGFETGQVTCNGNPAILPASLVEISIAGRGGIDFYDVRLVDGFNLPVSVATRGGTGKCKASSCPANVNAVCPAKLQVKGSDGSVLACKSACIAFNQPQYCCTGPFRPPKSCPPTNYSRIFKQQCPQAYSLATDDQNSSFTCSGAIDYVITFCP